MIIVPLMQGHHIMGSSKIVLTSEKSSLSVYKYFIARKMEKKGLKFDIIKGDMNTAVEFINILHHQLQVQKDD